MDLFGNTRSRIRNDHALIAPESHVMSALPGWKQTEIIQLISREMGSTRRAQFSQFLAVMQKGGSSAPAPAGIERVLFVLEGKITLQLNSEKHHLSAGGYAFLPTGSTSEFVAAEPSRLNIFEKRYTTLDGVAPPRALAGNEADIQASPFLGDEAAMLKTLLPTDLSFDLAVNVFTFQPGAALPLVEVHVMEHGLLMLQGAGIYRLADEWYPVQAGDVIWMAPYCPQWFGALGKSPAGYLYYKDMNRHPLEE